jgi:hypothetical protein
MTRRTAAALLLVSSLIPGLRADWKSELLSRLWPRPDYKAAWEYLVEESKNLEPEDRQTAGVLLPYLASKNGDAVRERDLAVEYFETYRDNDPDFGFLDDVTRRDFLFFWARWKRSYPLVYDLNLLSYDRSPATGLPATVDVGLDLLNEAFYRISLGPYILEGGHWTSGFHILTIPLNGLFERSDQVEFILDLKAGDLVIRKPVRIRIDLADVFTPSPSIPRESVFREAKAPARAIEAGEISLYVDGKLVLKSRKISPKPAAFTFPLGGPSMQGQQPYMPPPKDDPMARGVNILDALALAYKALKDLVARKPPPPSLPSYQKVDSLSFAYARTTGEGRTVSARASVTLVPSRAAEFRE